MKEIKAKQVIKDIKTLDKTADVSRRIKKVYIRTKNQTELPERNNNNSYVNDAENSIRDGTGTIVTKAGHIVENYGKREKAVYPYDIFSKTGCTIKQSAEPGRKTAKKTAKGTIKTSYKSVKTAEHTTKATIKTSQAATKNCFKNRSKICTGIKKSNICNQDVSQSSNSFLKMVAGAITVTVKATITAGKGIVALFISN